MLTGNIECLKNKTKMSGFAETLDLLLLFLVYAKNKRMMKRGRDGLRKK